MKNIEKQVTKIIQYIYDKIDDEISLSNLALAANMSESSVKRLFKDIFEETPGAFIRRLRMELAFKELQSKNLSVIESALSVGYNDHSAFSRSFKKAFGFSPIASRSKHNIMNELDHINLDDPEIVYMKEIKIQSITKQGSYFDAAPKAWTQLKDHLSDNELDDSFTGMYVGVGLDNPHLGNVLPNQVRFSAGLSCLSRKLHIDEITLPAGLYARFHFQGKPTQLGLAYHYILGQWQSKSKNNIRSDGLIYQIFDSLPDIEKTHTILICVPLLE